MVRYSEIGLKSPPIRRRFETALRDNILSRLEADGIEALVSFSDSRFYLEADDMDACVKAVTRVFGVASVSVAERCGSSMDEVKATAAEYSKGRIPKSGSFAVRARREGTHPYNSMELAKETGSAIFLANEGVRVDLTDPDVTFHVEVRDNRAYVFDTYIPGPGGIPLGTQGKVLALSGGNASVAAWLMMKRGCKVIFLGEGWDEILGKYDPNIKTSPDVPDYVLGFVSGASLDGVREVLSEGYGGPVYFPTVGMTSEEIQKIEKSMSAGEFASEWY